MTGSEPISLDASFARDPLSFYARHRAAGAAVEVVFPSGMSAWLVLDYAEGRRLLADARLSKSRERRAEVMSQRGSAQTGLQLMPEFSSHMLAADPPDHTRLRSLVNRAFTARRIAQLRPRVQIITNELVDALPTGRETDLVAELCEPLPIAVIAELLGAPEHDRPLLRRCADELFDGDTNDEQRLRAGRELSEYMAGLVERYRTEPAEVMLAALVEARVDSDALNDDELVSMSCLLLTAGYETTANLLANLILTLATDSQLFQRVRSDSGSFAAVIEEVLRVTSPAQMSTPRFTTEEVVCGGVTIPAGRMVYVSLLAANHDPKRFTAPDEFVPRRDDPGHLDFGHGIHHCLGAPLARLEADVVLATMTAAFSGIELAGAADTLPWRRNPIVHGVQRLPLVLHA